ncbi:MAG: RlmE family RNA methyltransferase, partial [Rhodobacteraceae bacterium]|nr:RlmE family RNA methyltransferase [Paracoccaceae bacterium]
KSARGKTVSQVKWLQRQLNDPYVRRAQLEGFRGRAAFKILELNEKFNFLIPGSKVVDLGCAPGGWSQVAVDLVNAIGTKKNAKIGSVIGIDLQEMESLPGATFHQIDFMADDSDLQVKNILEGKANVVMSDMAASSSGHKKTDHLRIMALCEAAAYFAFDVLEQGGTFVAKVLAGGAESDLQNLLKQKFTKVHNVKPPSSRSDSSEKFVVAMGFRD